MSKILNQYNNYKQKDSESVYIFRNGIFYISLNEDAKLLNDKIGLKLTSLSPEIVKCGFPISSLSKYTKILNNLHIKYTIIDNLPENTNIADYSNNIEIKKIINKLINLDLDNTTPIQALKILTDIQNKLKEMGE